MSPNDALPKLRDYLVIHERLEKIYDGKRPYLRLMARQYGVRAGDEDEVIDDAYMSLLGLEPREQIRSLLADWQRTPDNLACLDDSLTALLLTYLKFKCLDWLGTHPRDQPAGEVESAHPFAGLELQVTLAWLDRLVDRMNDSGQLTAMEWRYWHWRRRNPEGRAEDFAKHIDPLRKPGGWIKRAERSLFDKITRSVATLLSPREGRAETHPTGMAAELSSRRGQSD